MILTIHWIVNTYKDIYIYIAHDSFIESMLSLFIQTERFKRFLQTIYHGNQVTSTAEALFIFVFFSTLKHLFFRSKPRLTDRFASTEASALEFLISPFNEANASAFVMKSSLKQLLSKSRNRFIKVTNPWLDSIECLHCGALINWRLIDFHTALKNLVNSWGFRDVSNLVWGRVAFFYVLTYGCY